MPPTVVSTVKPVRVSSPLLVVMVTGVVPRALICARVTRVPSMRRLSRPSSALRVMLPVPVSLVSATVVRPASNTVVSPVAAPLPSTGVIDGPPSVTPSMVMVSWATSLRAPGSARV